MRSFRPTQTRCPSFIPRIYMLHHPNVPVKLPIISNCRRSLVTTCAVAEDNGSSRDEAAQQTYAPPPLKGPFVRAPIISYEKRLRPCRVCDGTRTVPCKMCDGRGSLGRAGYNAKNSVNASKVVGTKWTAMERTFGWRHFHANQKKKEGKDTFVLLQSTCQETVQLWVNIKTLKDRSLWASGWLQKTEIRAMENDDAGVDCKQCSGTGAVECPICLNAGKVVEL